MNGTWSEVAADRDERGGSYMFAVPSAKPLVLASGCSRLYEDPGWRPAPPAGGAGCRSCLIAPACKADLLTTGSPVSRAVRGWRDQSSKN